MDPLGTTIAVAAALVVLAGGAKVLAQLIKGWRRFFSVLDELAGEPAEFGRPAKPGLIEKVDLLAADIELIKHEVFPNSGHSLRDAVNRIEQSQGSTGSPVQVNVNPHPGG